MSDPVPDLLDSLIEEAVVYGELTAGTRAHWLSSQADARMVSVMAARHANQHERAAAWTPAEEQFVRANRWRMSDEELGQALGRSREAISIYWQRNLRLPMRSKDPECPTAREVGRMLGLGCSKTVVRWIEEGILPGYQLPMDRQVWGIPRQALVRFVVNPENWIYFRTERVEDPYLRRLVELRRARWHDAWWTPGQVCAYHGVTQGAINRAILEGRLPASRWGNWWIKRSDAVAFRITPRKGHTPEIAWTSTGDAFLLLARALGFSYTAIGALNGWPDSRVAFRLTALEKQQAVARVIRDHALAVQYDPQQGMLFADWRHYRGRFRRLETAILRFLHGSAKQRDLLYVAFTLQTWMQWHARDEAQRHAAYCMRFASRPAVWTLRRAYYAVQEWGIEPLAPAESLA